MPYDGAGVYEHYKGGLYDVLGLGLKEDTVDKRGEDGDHGHEVVCVVYQPLTPGSMLEHFFMEGAKPGVLHAVDFWLRELGDFDMFINENTPRFRKLELGEVLRMRNERLEEWMRYQILHDEL